FGTGTSQVFSLHGHVWQRNPYTDDSTVIGANNLSQWLGSHDNHGSTDHFDLLVDKAGGEAEQAGDYLYTVFQFLQARQGPWGIFRVGNPAAATQQNQACKVVVPTTQTSAAAAKAKAKANAKAERDAKQVERFIRKPRNTGSKP